jgi:hypothetical protein
MENSSHLFTDTSRLLEDDRCPLPSEADRSSGRHFMQASSTRRSEWTILRTSSVNGLLLGPRELTACAVAELGEELRRPVVWWAPAQSAEIPNLDAGTLVIRDVDGLDSRQQEELSRWIVVHSRGVQVLGLSREPFYEQVEAGRFSTWLYYRLNTVVVEVQTAADLP